MSNERVTKSQARHPAFQSRPKPGCDMYIPDSPFLTTSDQRRLTRLGLTKAQATELLRDGVQAPVSVVSLRTVQKGWST